MDGSTDAGELRDRSTIDWANQLMKSLVAKLYLGPSVGNAFILNPKMMNYVEKKNGQKDLIPGRYRLSDASSHLYKRVRPFVGPSVPYSTSLQ